MAVQSTRRTDDGYLVRQYAPPDMGQFLELHEAVFERRRSPEWVRWRHGGPYTDRVRMVVAERDGDLVGAEPFVPLRVRAGGTDVPALQPADVMVHPEHRRNGLLTRMTAFAVESCAGGPGLFFNFPNDVARTVHLRLGWREVGRVATAYRVPSPSAFTDGVDLPPAADGIVRGCYDAYDSVVGTATNALRRSAPEIRRHDDPPLEVLESLYERRPPDRLHVPRTAEFYRWRLASPAWDVTTYVAESGGSPVAALVVSAESRDGVTHAKLLDALPLVDPDPLALEGLAFAAISEHRSADAVTVAEDTLPRTVAERLGFLRNDGLPLSLVTASNPVHVRPFSLDAGTWSVGGRRLGDRDDWELSLVVQDTSL